MMKKNSWAAKLFVVLVMLFNYLPIIVVVVYSFNASKYGNWEGFSLEWYEELFRDRQIMRSLKNSLVLAVSSCALSILIGTAGAVGMAKSHFKTKNLLENVSMIPMMLPEIILGMAYLAFFSLLDVSFGMVTLIIAHTTFCIPYIFINVQSRLVGLDPAYVEAARDLGGNGVTCFLKIILPLSVPGIMSGVTMVFVPGVTTFVISQFLGSGKITLIGDIIEQQFMHSGNWGFGAAISIIVMIAVVLCMWLVNRFSDESGVMMP